MTTTTRYELTDGTEVLDVRNMTEDQFIEANQRAKENTDGNLYWRLSPPVKTIGKRGSAKRAYNQDEPPF